jgi:hypothetical protein
MGLERSTSFVPWHNSIASAVRPVDQNPFRRFQPLFVRKRFTILGRNRQLHRSGGIGVLRAAVLGANDGILSTSSLVLGAAAAHGTHRSGLVVFREIGRDGAQPLPSQPEVTAKHEAGWNNRNPKPTRPA